VNQDDVAGTTRQPEAVARQQRMRTTDVIADGFRMATLELSRFDETGEVKTP